MWTSKNRPLVLQVLAWYLGGLAATYLLLFAIAKLILETSAVNHLLVADRSSLLTIHRLASPTLSSVMIFITYLGSGKLVIAMCTLLAVVLASQSLWKYALSLTVALSGVTFVDFVVKREFARPRPLLFRVVSQTGFSFPSTHAMLSLTFYGLLAFMLFILMSSQAARILFVTLTAGLVVLIGFSRLYLGVHWPSDVAAGYLAGGLWLTCNIMALRAMESAREIGNR